MVVHHCQSTSRDLLAQAEVTCFRLLDHKINNVLIDVPEACVCDDKFVYLIHGDYSCLEIIIGIE